VRRESVAVATPPEIVPPAPAGEDSDSDMEYQAIANRMEINSRMRNSLLKTSDGSGSKFFDPGRVGLAIYGLGLNSKNLP